MIITKDYKWNKSNYNLFIKELSKLKDSDKYLEFNKKLALTNYKMIGIKMPILRKVAKEIKKTDIYKYLEYVKNDTFEETILEGLVISYIDDYDMFCKYFNKFVFKIDSWAICDTIVNSLKIIKSNQDLFFKEIKTYLKSNNEFVIRVGLVSLLNYYLEDLYIDEIFELIDNVVVDYYYVNMAKAWLISEAFSKYRNKTYNYIRKSKLNKFTKNMAIRKIIESNKVSINDKEKVRLLKG